MLYIIIIEADTLRLVAFSAATEGGSYHRRDLRQSFGDIGGTQERTTWVASHRDRGLPVVISIPELLTRVFFLRSLGPGAHFLCESDQFALVNRSVER